MIIKTDREGADAVAQLADLVLKASGIRMLSFVTGIVGTIQITEETETKEGEA